MRQFGKGYPHTEDNSVFQRISCGFLKLSPSELLCAHKLQPTPLRCQHLRIACPLAVHRSMETFYYIHNTYILFDQARLLRALPSDAPLHAMNALQ
jgi:hypothetical protein